MILLCIVECVCEGSVIQVKLPGCSLLPNKLTHDSTSKCVEWMLKEAQHQILQNTQIQRVKGSGSLLTWNMTLKNPKEMLNNQQDTQNVCKKYKMVPNVLQTRKHFTKRREETQKMHVTHKETLKQRETITKRCKMSSMTHRAIIQGYNNNHAWSVLHHSVICATLQENTQQLNSCTCTNLKLSTDWL